MLRLTSLLANPNLLSRGATEALKRPSLRASTPAWRPHAMASSAAHASRHAAFAGASVADLEQWLSSGGIQLGAYGSGAAKSLEQLWEEVQAGETQLFLDDGKPLREVSVLNVLLTNSRGQVLHEAEQVLPNGTLRSRGLPLSEKLLPGERWQDAVARGVAEELGPVLPRDHRVEVDEASLVETVEVNESQSYPGLRSKYVCKRVNARVPGLPDGDFTTDEDRADGLLRHCWVWR